MRKRVDHRGKRAAQALTDVETLIIRMGIHFPTEFVGEDLNEDFTGTSPKLHKTEVVDNSLASLDEILEASGQVPF